MGQGHEGTWPQGGDSPPGWFGGNLKCYGVQRKPPVPPAALPPRLASRREEHDQLSAPSQLYPDSSPETRDRSVTLKMSANTDQA